MLRSPTKVLQLFGGNLLTQVLFGVALAACVEAFGASVPLTELVLINTVVSLFAGLLPIPGGIGVSEAGLTLGLTARRTVRRRSPSPSPSPTASPASTCRRSGAGSATAG